MATNTNSVKKFYCKDCDYGTSKNSDWTKHLTRKKHLNEAKNYQKVDKKWKCNYCLKIYTHRSTICRHMHTCKKNTGTLIESYKCVKEKELLQEDVVKIQKEILTLTIYNIKIKIKLKELQKKMEKIENLLVGN